MVLEMMSPASVALYKSSVSVILPPKYRTVFCRACSPKKSILGVVRLFFKDSCSKLRATEPANPAKRLVIFPISGYHFNHCVNNPVSLHLNSKSPNRISLEQLKTPIVSAATTEIQPVQRYNRFSCLLAYSPVSQSRLGFS